MIFSFLRAIDGKLDEISRKLDRTYSLLRTILTEEIIMSKEMDDLKSAVAANGNAVNSAVTAFQGIAAQILANANDPAAIEDLATQLNSQSTALAAAVVQGTPAASSGGGAAPQG
jgi:hypothetical protein